MRGERFSIDTNILVYSTDREAGRRRALATEVLTEEAAALLMR